MCGTSEGVIPPKPGANQPFGFGDESRPRLEEGPGGRLFPLFFSLTAGDYILTASSSAIVCSEFFCL
jgi:hypothetical protein